MKFIEMKEQEDMMSLRMDPLYHKQHHPCLFKDEDRIPHSLEDAIITF